MPYYTQVRAALQDAIEQVGVVPAQAGTEQFLSSTWIPACAGMTPHQAGDAAMWRFRFGFPLAQE